MKQFKHTLASFVAVTLVGGIFLSLASPSEAQLPAKKKIEAEPKEPKKNPPPPPPPEPGAFSGYINGKLSLVTRERGVVVPGKPGATSTKVVGSPIDLKAQLSSLWNGNRDAVEAQVREMLKKPINGHNMYNVKITLASASAANKLFMSVSPKNKQLTLRYTLPSNKITCTAEVDWWFDQPVSMTFDLEVVMVIRTNGSKSDPLVLSSATVVVRNAVVRVDGDRNSSAERTLNSKSLDIRSKLLPAIAALNNITLRPYVNQGFSMISPAHTLPGVSTSSDVLILMERPPLVASPR